MTTVCHLWPSISPWSIWDLPYRVWVGFSLSADQYIESMKER